MQSGLSGKLVFASTANTGNSQIYLINLDGTGFTNLSHDDKWNAFPLVSPDNKKIAYLSSDVRDSLTNIYVMNPDGTDRKQLTKDGITPGARFVWSPDSTKIAFEKSVQHQAQISVVDLDGKVKQLTDSIDIYNARPARSSNNTVVFERILFDEYRRPDNQSLIEMNVENDHIKTLIEYRENTGNYILSPDLSKIAFVEAKEGRDNNFDFVYSIHVMDVDGSNARKIADGFLYLDFDIRWSPDGRHLALQGFKEFSAIPRIYVGDLNRGIVNTATDTNTNEWHPVWSQDGRIAFIKDVGKYLPAIHATDSYLRNFQQVSEIGYPFSTGSVDWLN
jgi:Tol biopolymer transport system component